MVLFKSLAIFYKEFITKNAVKLSRPEVGSSSIKTLGSEIISKAIDTLFLSPP